MADQLKGGNSIQLLPVDGKESPADTRRRHVPHAFVHAGRILSGCKRDVTEHHGGHWPHPASPATFVVWIAYGLTRLADEVDFGVGSIRRIAPGFASVTTYPDRRASAHIANSLFEVGEQRFSTDGPARREHHLVEVRAGATRLTNKVSLPRRETFRRFCRTTLRRGDRSRHPDRHTRLIHPFAPRLVGDDVTQYSRPKVTTGQPFLPA